MQPPCRPPGATAHDPATGAGLNRRRAPHMGDVVTRWLIALAFAACLPATAQPLVRLDHIPTAVHSLARVVAD